MSLTQTIRCPAIAAVIQISVTMTWGAIVNVPANQPTIGAGINVAQRGPAVLLSRISEWSIY
ncbi:MAG: hypothetical protein ACR2IE_03885 [Candidatus Sumerlaeaceae bacterium]